MQLKIAQFLWLREEKNGRAERLKPDAENRGELNPSLMEVEGDELSAGVKPPRGVLSLIEIQGVKGVTPTQGDNSEGPPGVHR